jgi:selenide,water dikinase
VTGYGLGGHAAEMADGAGLTFEIEVASLPLIEGVAPLATSRFHTRASKSNRDSLAGRMEVNPRADALALEFVFDAQTSGGLLITIAADRAPLLVAELKARGAAASAVIGRVIERTGDLAIRLA